MESLNSSNSYYASDSSSTSAKSFYGIGTSSFITPDSAMCIFCKSISLLTKVYQLPTPP